MMRLVSLCFILLASFAPASARADRGAFTLDGGFVLSAAQVNPGVGKGDSVMGTNGGAALGLRYGLRHSLELAATAFWFNPVAFYNDNTTIETRDGTFTGQLQSQVGRFGLTAGAYYVHGLVWRLRAGAEIGWSQVSYNNLDLINVDDPSNPGTFGLALKNRSVTAFTVSPAVGLEWMITDSLSFSVNPRLDLIIGDPQLTAFTVPFVVSYSWYGLFH